MIFQMFAGEVSTGRLFDRYRLVPSSAHGVPAPVQGSPGAISTAGASSAAVAGASIAAADEATSSWRLAGAGVGLPGVDKACCHESSTVPPPSTTVSACDMLLLLLLSDDEVKTLAIFIMVVPGAASTFSVRPSVTVSSGDTAPILYVTFP